MNFHQMSINDRRRLRALQLLDFQRVYEDEIDNQWDQIMNHVPAVPTLRDRKLFLYGRLPNFPYPDGDSNREPLSVRELASLVYRNRWNGILLEYTNQEGAAVTATDINWKVLVQSFYEQEIKFHVSLSRHYFHGVPSEKVLFIFKDSTWAYRVWRDLQSRRRLWRLLILEPQLKFIPYRFPYPYELGSKYEIAVGKSGTGFKIPKGTIYSPVRHQLSDGKFEVYFLMGSFPEVAVDLPIQGKILGKSPLKEDIEYRHRGLGHDAFKGNGVYRLRIPASYERAYVRLEYMEDLSQRYLNQDPEIKSQVDRNGQEFVNFDNAIKEQLEGHADTDRIAHYNSASLSHYPQLLRREYQIQRHDMNVSQRKMEAEMKLLMRHTDGLIIARASRLEPQVTEPIDYSFYERHEDNTYTMINIEHVAVNANQPSAVARVAQIPEVPPSRTDLTAGMAGAYQLCAASEAWPNNSRDMTVEQIDRYFYELENNNYIDPDIQRLQQMAQQNRDQGLNPQVPRLQSQIQAAPSMTQTVQAQQVPQPMEIFQDAQPQLPDTQQEQQNRQIGVQEMRTIVSEQVRAAFAERPASPTQEYMDLIRAAMTQQTQQINMILEQYGNLYKKVNEQDTSLHNLAMQVKGYKEIEEAKNISESSKAQGSSDSDYTAVLEEQKSQSRRMIKQYQGLTQDFGAWASMLQNVDQNVTTMKTITETKVKVSEQRTPVSEGLHVSKDTSSQNSILAQLSELTKAFEESKQTFQELMIQLSNYRAADQKLFESYIEEGKEKQKNTLMRAKEVIGNRNDSWFQEIRDKIASYSSGIQGLNAQQTQVYQELSLVRRLLTVDADQPLSTALNELAKIARTSVQDLDNRCKLLTQVQVGTTDQPIKDANMESPENQESRLTLHQKEQFDQSQNPDDVLKTYQTIYKNTYDVTESTTTSFTDSLARGVMEKTTESQKVLIQRMEELHSKFDEITIASSQKKTKSSGRK